MVGALHRALVVRDDDELRALLQLAHQPGEGGEAELVERRVDFVHHTERARIEQEQRKYQGHRGERLFAAREQSDLLHFFAGRLDQDVDAGVEDIVGGGQFEAAFAAAQEFGEQLLEVSARRPRRFWQSVCAPRD